LTDDSAAAATACCKTRLGLNCQLEKIAADQLQLGMRKIGFRRFVVSITKVRIDRIAISRFYVTLGHRVCRIRGA
jgi:hypothetical protein